MNELEFLEKWSEESPMYCAWGSFVSSKICESLEQSGKILSSYLKQSPEQRTKDAASLLDKAFYRANKHYQNPYDDIEDKVGCRFVVLLVEQIEDLTSIIRDEQSWDYKECRHFQTEKDNEPLLFTYQSVHYVVRAKTDFYHNDSLIKAGTACEIQIRTLLQHAYAELTHDAVYKAKTLVEPDVHRTVAKSMALIETTDDFFSTVSTRLNSSSSDNLCFQYQLDELYLRYIGSSSLQAQKSSIVILDEFDHLIDEHSLTKLENFLNKNSYIADAIRLGCKSNPFYTQSVILFVYFLIKRKKNILLRDWPLSKSIIERLAVDIGASLDIF
jgi:ppGpp synthetase/RelA/SpoT-type nucleotidyltranferase